MMDLPALRKCARRLNSRMPLIGAYWRRKAAEALADDRSPTAAWLLALAVARPPDRRVRDIALRAVEAATDPACVDRVCRAWAETLDQTLCDLIERRGWVASDPPATRVLSALKVGRTEVCEGAGGQMAETLVDACTDRDEQIAGTARSCAAALRRHDAVDTLCRRWAESRDPLLADIICRAGYVAEQPAAVHVLTALKTNNRQTLSALGPDAVGPLLDACDDADTVIAAAARDALRNLEDADARDALCRQVIEADPPLARQAALDAEYLPQNEGDRALFLFLTDQLDRYEQLDFDGRLLRLAYASAQGTLRERIRTRLRATGRTQYLQIIVGGDHRTRVAEMGPREIELCIQMLAAGEEWPKLWRLALDVPFVHSAAVVRQLGERNWQPDATDEAETFRTLAALVAEEVPQSPEQVSERLPPIIREAEARVPGRINDLAFSPVGPHIGLGTGAGKVVLWDFQRAERLTLWKDFDHSIGQLGFSPDGVLVCGERTNTGEPCSLYALPDGEQIKLTEHIDSITVVEPAGESRILVADHGKNVAVWDVARRTKLKEHAFRFWARAARVAPDGASAALVHRGVTVVNLPDLEERRRTRNWSRRGAARSVAFAPDGESLFVGRFVGEVVPCHAAGKALTPEGQGLADLRSDVRGLEVLPNRPILIAAGSAGDVRLIDLTDRSVVAQLKTNGDVLTSLHVSPDGSFMAVGDSDASFSLWDLRSLDLPRLFQEPLARLSLNDLPKIAPFAESERIDPSVRRGLLYMRCAIRHRFRYDVEIEAQIQLIRPGEFDIEIDG